MIHTCHAHACTIAVSPRMAFCRAHWFALSETLRAAIWREYKPGQERTKKPSERYLAVQRRAAAELAFKPNDEDAARVMAGYLLDSETWRSLAITRGMGDPLEGYARLGAA